MALKGMSTDDNMSSDKSVKGGLNHENRKRDPRILEQLIQLHQVSRREYVNVFIRAYVDAVEQHFLTVVNWRLS